MKEMKLVKVAIASVTIVATLVASAQAVSQSVVKEEVETHRHHEIAMITHQYKD